MKKKALWITLVVVALAVGIETLQIVHMRSNSWKNSGGWGACDFLYPESIDGLFSYKCHRSPNGKATYIPIICIGNRLLVYNAVEGGQKSIATYYMN